MVDEKKRLFKKEYAKELVAIARGDLKSAMFLNQPQAEGRPENIVFLAQQSVEKALKAVLVHSQVSFPLVHDLGVLVALMPEDLEPPGGFKLSELNPYATIRRYEEGVSELGKEEVEASLQAAEAVVLWAEKNIQ